MPADACARPVILGCGYLGRYLADDLRAAGQAPLCLVKSAHRQQQLAAAGFAVRRLDLDSRPADAGLSGGADIYYFAPPGRYDDKDHRIDQFLNVCSAKPPRRIVYTSTSGVYGDCQGKVVDEQAPLAPLTGRAKRRVYAENALRNFCAATPSEYIILRVGGIYGPERLPLHRLKDITVICQSQAPPSNRIHVADLATVCQSAMRTALKNEVFNVSDGHSSSMTDYYFQIADRAKRPRPAAVPLSQARQKLSPAMLSFVSESRILSTQKLHTLLNVQLKFPTLEAGLEDCFKESLIQSELPAAQ